MDERALTLLMAALIASVRTARFESKDFKGMLTPRMQAEIMNSLALARHLMERAPDVLDR